MKLQLLDVSAIGAFGLGSVSGASSYFGWFNFINTYSQGLGVVIAFLSFVTGVYFMTRSARSQSPLTSYPRPLLPGEGDSFA